MIEYFIGAAVCVVASWFWSKSRPSKLPPGPLCYPILNNLHNVSMEGHKFTDSMEKLHKEYGPTISLCLVGHNIWDIWITNFDMIKEVLYDPRFASRKATGLWLEQGMDKGLTFTGLEDARAKRKVMSKFLSSLGVGKTVFAEGIEDETQKLMKYLAETSGQHISTQVKYCTPCCQLHLLRYLFLWYVSENLRLCDQQHHHDASIQQVVRI